MGKFAQNYVWSSGQFRRICLNVTAASELQLCTLRSSFRKCTFSLLSHYEACAELVLADVQRQTNRHIWPCNLSWHLLHVYWIMLCNINVSNYLPLQRLVAGISALLLPGLCHKLDWWARINGSDAARSPQKHEKWHSGEQKQLANCLGTPQQRSSWQCKLPTPSKEPRLHWDVRHYWTKTLYCTATDTHRR